MEIPNVWVAYSEVTFSVLPEDHSEYLYFRTTIHRWKNNLWALKHLAFYWNFVTEKWELPPSNSEIGAEWKTEHLRPHSEAYAKAIEVTPTITINRYSVYDALELFS